MSAYNSAAVRSSGWFSSCTVAPSVFVIAALMASVPLENSTVLPEIGSISRLIGLLAAAAVLIDSVTGVEIRRLHAAHAPLALFVIWSAWTCFWSVDPELSTERFTTNLQLLILVWLIWQSVRDLRHLRIVLEGFVLGSCAAVLFTIVKSRNLEAIDAIRYAGAGADPNELGLTLALSLPMAYYLFATARALPARVFWLLTLPFCMIGIVLTASRAGLIATVLVMLGISVWHFLTSSRMRLAPFVAGFLLLAAGVVFTPKADLERYATIGDEVSSGRIGKRTRIWRVGMELFSERPLTGIGAATFGYASEPLLGKDLVAHNVYVSILTETGIVGFLIFASALAGLFISAAALDLPERCLWLTVMVTWCVGVMSLTWEYKKITWSIFGLLIATAGLWRRPAPKASEQLPKYILVG